MFSGLLAKATAILGVIVAFLLAMLKYKNNKIDRQDDIIDGHEKKDEITEDMNLAEIEAKEKEDNASKDINDSNWKSRI